MPYLLALKALPWKLIGWAVIAFAFVAFLAALRIEQAQNAKLKAQLHECVTLRATDRANYEAAQKKAAADNHAQVQKVETEQQRITTDVEADYQHKLDVMRRELREQSAAPKGSAGNSGTPKVPDPAPKSGEKAGLPLSDAERLRAAENELQLDELITWVEQQSKIDPNQ